MTFLLLLWDSGLDLHIVFSKCLSPSFYFLGSLIAEPHIATPSHHRPDAPHYRTHWLQKSKSPTHHLEEEPSRVGEKTPLLFEIFPAKLDLIAAHS